MIQIKTFLANHYIDGSARASLDYQVNAFFRKHRHARYVDLKAEASVTANHESDLIYVLVYKTARPKELPSHHFRSHKYRPNTIAPHKVHFMPPRY